MGRTAFWGRIKQSLSENQYTASTVTWSIFVFSVPLVYLNEKMIVAAPPHHLQQHQQWCFSLWTLASCQIYTEEDCTDMICRSHCELLTSMSSTGRFPLWLNWFLNAAFRHFCAAHNVPLKKIITSIPFYPAFCHSVHLGKYSNCMIRGILKEKPSEFSISLFSSSYYSVSEANSVGFILSKCFDSCSTYCVAWRLQHWKWHLL